MSNEFIPRNIGNKNCDAPIVGTPHPNFDYIHRTTTGDDDYPVEACGRYLQVNGKFDNLQVTSNITAASANITDCHLQTFDDALSGDVRQPTRDA
jgi:hypothetical protein